MAMHQVKLLIDSQGPNPNFDRTKPVSEANPLEITVPAGTVLKDKYAWMHCMPDAASGVVRAEPDSDVTRELVEAKSKERELAMQARLQAEEQRVLKSQEQRKSRRPKSTTK